MSHFGIFEPGLEKATVLWYFIWAPSNFSKQKISSKNKTPQIWNQNYFNWVFWAGISKNYFVFEISILEFVNMQSFIQKWKKTLNLRLKRPYVGYLSIFRLKFSKDQFLISNLEFKKLWTFTQNEKNKLGTKKTLFGFWTGMLKNFCHICNQRPPIFLIAKFCVRIRILKFGTKNALFECFGQQFRKIIAIFAVSILKFASLQSLMQKIKILKFGTKSVRFPSFRAGIWKCYCHIWEQPPRICLDVKFGAKIKESLNWNQRCLIWNLWTGIWK